MSEEAPRPLRPFGAPPRSGEDLGRGRHRTVGADPQNVQNARKLRSEMSLPEVLLWRELRGKPLGIKFRRQFPILGFVADFACAEARLIIAATAGVVELVSLPAASNCAASTKAASTAL